LRRPLESFFAKSTHSPEIFEEITLAAIKHFGGNFVLQTLKPSLLGLVEEDFVLQALTSTVLGLPEEDSKKLRQLILNLLSPGPPFHPTAKKDFENYMTKALDKKEFKPGRVLDILAENTDFTNEEKISTIKLLIFAGLDTTTRFIHFFVPTLEVHSSYKEEIVKEWAEFSKGKHITDENFLIVFKDFVESSKWLEACYLEALRHFPAIPDIKRIAKKNLQIGYLKIAIGDEIHLNLLGYQRDEKAWGSEASCFMPEKFLGKAVSGLLNFSIGRQGCIGRNVAKTEAKIYAALFALFSQKKPRTAEKLKVEEACKEELKKILSMSSIPFVEIFGLTSVLEVFGLKSIWPSYFNEFELESDCIPIKLLQSSESKKRSKQPEKSEI
jgi:cytochrome P450